MKTALAAEDAHCATCGLTNDETRRAFRNMTQRADQLKGVDQGLHEPAEDEIPGLFGLDREDLWGQS